MAVIDEMQGFLHCASWGRPKSKGDPPFTMKP
jgi:hypothetical protein